MWVKTVLNIKDRKGGGGQYDFETPEWHQAYANKHRIARALCVTSVLEIGVRYGYAAHAFLSAGATRYIGIDSDLPEHNQMGEPTCDKAMLMLRQTCPHSNNLLIRADTQISNPMASLTPVDFVHIDANHQYIGAMTDMTNAWPICTRAMLVDDYFCSSPVHDAVDAFVGRYGALLVTSPSGTGEALILR